MLYMLMYLPLVTLYHTRFYSASLSLEPSWFLFENGLISKHTLNISINKCLVISLLHLNRRDIDEQSTFDPNYSVEYTRRTVSWLKNGFNHASALYYTTSCSESTLASFDDRIRRYSNSA